jgi:hypothetical protein
MNLDKLLTEEIKRYQELMGQNSEILNEVFNPNVFAKGLSRFARGAARNVLDNIVTKEIKSGVNKAFKNTTSAFFSDIISGAKKLDDFATKVKPQEVSDNIIKGLKKQGYVLTNLEEMALRKEVQTSVNKTVKGTSSRLRMFKKSFNSAELAEFNRLKAGKNLTDDQLLKLARKSKGAKIKPKPITNPIDNQIDNQIDNTVDNTTSGIKSKFQKVKEAWKKIGVWWNGLSRAQRRFYRVAGLILGVSLLAWLYSVLAKEGYCKCLLNMMQDSDAEYMDSISMDDAMFLGKTGNSEIDAQGGGIFYGDGKFKSKNGRMQGSYTCNDEGVFINVGGAKYQLQCAGGIEDLLPIPVNPGDTGTISGNTETIVYKDCEGPEYQLGCTDKGDTIERVQACLKLPVTGKFDKDLENALIKKIGKKTFTEQDVFIICDVKSTTKFTFG